MGELKNTWQEREEVLGLFGRKEKEARKHYESYVGDGIRMGKRPDLVGGGLKRSNGGVWPNKNERRCYDSRVLGGSEFVEGLHRQIEKAEEKAGQLKKLGWENFVSAVATAQGVPTRNLYEKGRRQAVSDGKAMLIYAGTT
jgi:hypothetical protein